MKRDILNYIPKCYVCLHTYVLMPPLAVENGPHCENCSLTLRYLAIIMLPVNRQFSLSSSQSPVTIADGVNGSPTEYIFSYNGSPIPVTTGSTLQCTNSSCQRTFRVTSSPVPQYTVSVAARNVVGVGNASTPVTVGM